jgi:predicted glutamine amidotransferase
MPHDEGRGTSDSPALFSFVRYTTVHCRIGAEKCPPFLGGQWTLASDERLQELKRLIQTETDFEKLLALTEKSDRRVQELQEMEKSSKPAGTGNAA